ncbi:MAG: glycoside hydrolase family 76 protein [Ferruginibacter sp.]
MNKLLFCVWMTVIIIVATSCGKDKVTPPPPTPPPVDTVAVVPISYLKLARETHDFVLGNLVTQYSSYRANTTSHSNEAYEWYNVSQVYADAAMIGAGDASYLSYMNNTFIWMDNMWDKKDPNGGYFASCHLDGTGAGGDKYVDDNGLTGMVFLEAYDLTTGTDKAAYLTRAKACGDWIIKSGLWDDTYGGGFWWSTAKTFKPTQANGVALQLFLRLYKITGQPEYKDWAIKTDAWLTSMLFDATKRLYIWKIDGPGAGTKHTEIFTYDNAVMIEADLLYNTVLNEPAYLTKAQALGTAMNTTLWNPLYKMYIFNTDPSQSRVNPAWCGWGSQGMIRLYEADKNSNWLNYAQNNIDGLNKACRDANTHGYSFFARMDGGDSAPEREGVDQAWMQRIQALMSKYR